MHSLRHLLTAMVPPHRADSARTGPDKEKSPVNETGLNTQKQSWGLACQGRPDLNRKVCR